MLLYELRCTTNGTTIDDGVWALGVPASGVDALLELVVPVPAVGVAAPLAGAVELP